MPPHRKPLDMNLSLGDLKLIERSLALLLAALPKQYTKPVESLHARFTYYIQLEISNRKLRIKRSWSQKKSAKP